LFKGVAFVDAGNTFLNASRVSLADLKVGAGWGLRLATPFALIRFDVGYPMNNGPEHRPRYYFSIGQAF
jgi:outer membrane translocation and assembly module TamA